MNEPTAAAGPGVAITLRGSLARDESALDRAPALVRELTGQDAAAWTSQDGTMTIVWPSGAPAYPAVTANATKGT